MTRIELPFSRHAGLTLPQVLFKDPGWFFWAHTRPLHGAIAYEVQALYPKATRIRVPVTIPHHVAAEAPSTVAWVSAPLQQAPTSARSGSAGTGPPRLDSLS